MHRMWKNFHQGEVAICSESSQTESVYINAQNVDKYEQTINLV